MSEEKDSETRVALLVVFALITLVVLGVLWFGAYQGIGAKKQPAMVAAAPHVAAAPSAVTAAATTAAVATPAATDAGRVVVENDVVKFFFPSGSAQLPTGGEQALAGLVSAMQANPNLQAVISGFTDSTGSAAANAELAKQRALSVQGLLSSLGIAAERLQLREPATHTGTGDNSQARRVEVSLLEAQPVQTIVAPAPAQASAPAVAPTDSDGARVIVENGIVKIYFASGKSEIAPGASDALLEIVTAINSGRTAIISGFTDSSGSVELNKELSKRRAFAVRDLLLSMNIPEASLELKEPETLTGTGNPAEARRVEVRLAN